MAAKYFCDGCGGDILDYTANRHKWIINIASNTSSVLSDQYDLCQGCAEHLKTAANPKRWPRQAQPKSAA